MTSELLFTGERFLPNLAGEMWAEHWHRYHFVLPLIKNKSVLDVASGEGYGSALMAGVASSVTGVDVSTDAVAHAGTAYAARGNLKFVAASCAKLPFDDAAFDSVVSFETIEHILLQDEFLDEIKRVLKPSGTLIMSSPNRAEYSDARAYANEFHVKELYRAEFAALLGARFRQLRWFSQRNAFVSLINPETADATSETLTISKANPEAALPALPALYFLVCATNDDATLAAFSPRLSVLSDSEEWAYNDYRKIYQASLASCKNEAALEARCAELETQLARLRAAVAVPPPPSAETPSWLTRLLKRLSK